MKQRDDQASTACTDRMTERTRAAIDVEFFVRDAEFAHRRHRHARERFIDFEQVHLLGLPARLLQHVCNRSHRRGGEATAIAVELA